MKRSRTATSLPYGLVGLRAAIGLLAIRVLGAWEVHGQELHGQHLQAQQVVAQEVAAEQVWIPLRPEALVDETVWGRAVGILDEQEAVEHEAIDQDAVDHETIDRDAVVGEVIPGEAVTDESVTADPVPPDAGTPDAVAGKRIGLAPKGRPEKPWGTDWSHARDFPESAYLDLGRERPLAALWVFDVHDVGTLEISVGSPGSWEKVAAYETLAFESWARIPLDAKTRYLRLARVKPGAQIAEAVLYEYTPEGWAALEARKAAQARAALERRAALARAEEEAKRRPLVDLGPPWGSLPLVDEVAADAGDAGHLFAEQPAGASRVETVLGEPCRILEPRPSEASYVSWRIGRHKLLRPGAAYLLAIEYPEDLPRSMLVLNGGCETASGFHTGTTVGDALRARYVGSNPESLRVPLSGRIETWKQLFFLHDRFPRRAFIRGAGPRPLAAEDGFPLTVAQFSAENDPPSRGIALGRIRLFEVPDAGRLRLRIARPPAGLPRRHIFWREEMADGVIDAAKPEERGVAEMLDWYRHKAALMGFLGIDAFAKDLLEFGACQHWDPTPGGGNDWVFHSDRHKGLWEGIVDLMGREGLSLLPYYEYAGSRGYRGLGAQRRARPLGRDDAFTHIGWVEAANADITDPETLTDFRKMLDLTVVRFKERAAFLGAWLRPRSQLPMGFGDATRERFAREANGGRAVTRAELLSDAALRETYRAWWLGKRRAFLEGVRDHLRSAGLGPEAVVLFTADASEPGPSFPSWEPKLVTDDPEGCLAWLAPGNAGKPRPILPLGIDEVVRGDLFLAALTSPPLDWGGWEPSHASPAADPERYRDVPGVLLTHGFNRAYTVASPRTFDAFRGPSGLAIVRHHALNENMLFDRDEEDILGYVVVDVERAGPYSMLAEARAVANGDPRYLGYLLGSSLSRGFPEAVRDFNAAFLALPALPSRRLDGVTDDREVAVRAIAAEGHGAWLAVVNTGLGAKEGVAIRLAPSGLRPSASALRPPALRGSASDFRLPEGATLIDAVSGEAVPWRDGAAVLDLGPCELRALRVLCEGAAPGAAPASSSGP